MEQESRSALAKGLILVGVATMVGNGAAFLLSMVAARVLGPDDFGAFGALVGILLILVTVAISIQALAARRVATARSGGPGSNESDSDNADSDNAESDHAAPTAPMSRVNSSGWRLSSDSVSPSAGSSPRGHWAPSFPSRGSRWRREWPLSAS